MAICDLSALNDRLGPGARLMGLDLGARTMGVAISDVSRTIATARTTLRRTRLSRDIETLRAMVEAEGIGAIVVGLPVNMDGSEGPRAQSARDIAAAAGRRAGVAGRLLGRAAFHGCRRAPPARRRSLAAQAGPRRRPGGGGLHPAGRAGSASQGVASDPLRELLPLCTPPARHGRGRARPQGRERGVESPGYPRVFRAAGTKNVNARNTPGLDPGAGHDDAQEGRGRRHRAFSRDLGLRPQSARQVMRQSMAPALSRRA